jgi:uncharacterized membrane protein (UPF0127 family)
MSRLVVERASNGNPLWTVDVAQSWVSRLRGLIGHGSLGAGDGLYFPGTNGIHMLFMRFAIDCVFVGSESPDGTREVVAVRPNLRPWTGVVWFVRGARGAVEVAAGSAASVGVKAGDRVRLRVI